MDFKDNPVWCVFISGVQIGKTDFIRQRVQDWAEQNSFHRETPKDIAEEVNELTKPKRIENG